ncbi:MAG: DUF5678 domain-containing protein [Patescibacteria group bacterium]
MKKKIASQNLITQAYHNPKYEGKHIIVIGGKVHATKTGMAQVKLLERLIRKYPQEKPSIAYIPDAETLILLLI